MCLKKKSLNLIAEVGLQWVRVEYEFDRNTVTIFGVQNCEPDRYYACNWTGWELLVCLLLSYPKLYDLTLRCYLDKLILVPFHFIKLNWRLKMGLLILIFSSLKTSHFNKFPTVVLMPLFKFPSKYHNVETKLDNVKGRLLILPCEDALFFAVIVHRVWGSFCLDLHA